MVCYIRSGCYNHYMTKDNTANAVFDLLVDGFQLTPSRLESLRSAIELGASGESLIKIRDCSICRKQSQVILPALRYESLSRGRGWARKGRGTVVAWGERIDTGYLVGPGRWEVGATDGFSRKDKCTWDVEHVSVGDQTWTIAN